MHHPKFLRKRSKHVGREIGIDEESAKTSFLKTMLHMLSWDPHGRLSASEARALLEGLDQAAKGGHIIGSGEPSTKRYPEGSSPSSRDPPPRRRGSHA